jgi:hypothetical protein
MKLLSILNLIFSIIILLTGLYIYFVLVPKEHHMEELFTYYIHSDDGSFGASMEHTRKLSLQWDEAQDMTNKFSYVALFGGLLVMAVGAFVGIKKQSIGWLAVILAFGGTFIGAMYGTHLFSGMLL